MEALIVLVVLGLAGLALLGPILAVVGLVRAGRLERRLGELRRDVEAIEARLAAALKTLPSERPARERAAPSDVPVETPAAPGTAFTSAVRPPERSAAAPPAEPSTPPLPRGPAPPAPARVPAAVSPWATDTPRVVSAAGPPLEPRGPEPPSSAPPIPAPPASASSPPPPSGPPFDWEKLLGLRGAAVAGAITLVIAAVLLAKLAIAKGYITPEIRVALMVLAGAGGLVWAELSLRRGYAITANAVSGAGIAILYVAFFAAHSLYGLLPLGLTFALMALVTVVAGLLSIRYDALPTAVLGLLGGFATPMALSTGVDRPIGLFSYILLLNVGLAAIALRRRWHALLLLSVAGTFVIEIGWFGRFMAPEKMLVGLSAFLLFGLFFLFLPLLGGKSDDEGLLQTGAAGALAPFLFALLLANNTRFAAEWPLLFAYLGLLDLALIAVALRRGRLELLLGASLATALTLPLWAREGLTTGTLWGATLSAIALCLFLNAVPRLAAALAARLLEERAAIFEMSGALSGAGLGVFALILVGRGLGEPPWLFMTLLAALGAILVERSGERRLPGVMVLGAAALALLAQAWFFAATAPATLARNLSVPLLLAVGLSLLAGWRAGSRDRSPRAGDEDEAGTVAAVLAGSAGLFGCLLSSRLGADPRPLFAGLAVQSVLLVVSALRRGWTPLVPLALLSAAVFATVWQAAYFQPADALLAVSLYGAFCLGFLVLPLALPERLAATWRGRAAPWLASSLSGPFFFLPLYDAITRAWGKAWIGALPVTLAGVTVVALAGVSRRFPAVPGDAPARRRRLDYLALFAAIALGFVALAIPLQLDRQWITVAWALEAMAVWWLFGRLPHPGLKLFGALLYTCVGARLLLNPEVLSYQPRGLPILNWLLYTYGIPAMSCLVGAAFLRKADERTRLAPAASFLGLLLIFALINLEIVDYFSEGPQLAFRFERDMARDLTMSLAWGLYAVALLVLGMWRQAQSLRLLSLGFLVLTIGKVFLFDLANLGGLYRILSFLGLGISLIVVSLLYQRFVFRKQAAS